VYEVTANSLNLRAEPSTQGAVIGALKQGTRLQGHSADDGWLRVETDAGVFGYVAADFVRRVETEASAEADEEVAPADAPAGSPAPAGSKLAQVDLGMSEAEVTNILGEPTSRDNYQTGKAWIPYYYGSDTSRLDYKYENLGVVVFGRNRYSGKTRVIRVDYDPNEDGY
jgi:uncharacterized protein YgiM (DUF1202 family)